MNDEMPQRGFYFNGEKNESKKKPKCDMSSTFNARQQIHRREFCHETFKMSHDRNPFTGRYVLEGEFVERGTENRTDTGQIGNAKFHIQYQKHKM